MKTCKKCEDKGYFIEDGDIKYCSCAKGENLELIEKKRAAKGYPDNY